MPARPKRRRRRNRHPAIGAVIALFERPLVRILTVALAPAAGIGVINTGQLMQAHQELAAVRDTVLSARDSTAVHDSTAARARGRLRRTVDSLVVVSRDLDYRLLRIERAALLDRERFLGPPLPKHPRPD